MGQNEILSKESVTNILEDHNLPFEETVVVVTDSSCTENLYPSDMILAPFVQMEFAQNPKLAMVYGVAPGVVFIRSSAIQALQHQIELTGRKISDCGDLIAALRQRGYIAKRYGTPDHIAQNLPSRPERLPLKFILLLIFMAVPIVAIVVGATISSHNGAGGIGAFWGLVGGCLIAIAGFLFLQRWK